MKKKTTQRFLKYSVLQYLVDYVLDNLIYVVSLGACAIISYLSTKVEIPYLASLSNITKVTLISIVIFIIFVGCKFYVKIKKNSKLIRNSGLFLFQPNRESGDIEANRLLMEEKSSNARDILILGATGYNTFVRSDTESKAMLREQLERVTGEIKIMLLHPKAQQAETRAKSLGVPLGDYQQEIYNSINFLKELKSKGQNISLKLYVQQPIWKMILLDNFLWLQYYHPKTHVEKMPVYGIHRKQPIGEYSLFGPLYEVFQKKWINDENPTVDLRSDIIPAHQHDPSTNIDETIK